MARADDDDAFFSSSVDDGDVYAWEKEYQRSWEQLPDDTQQQLSHLASVEFQKRSKRRLLFQSHHKSGVRRGMTRYVVLVLDYSVHAEQRSGRHTRGELLRKAAEEFVTEYFDQNPISHLALLVTRDAVAQRLTDLSATSQKHIAALRKDVHISGDPSLQNALLTAQQTLSGAPWFGMKEIIILYSSLCTRDPGDVFETIEELARQNIRCSVVGLGAEVFALKHLCNSTGGAYAVGLDPQHFHDLVLAHAPPPTTLGEEEEKPTALIRMGFPKSETEQSGLPSLCACHMEPRSQGYICPQCKSKCCEIPNECPVCGLVLLSSTHLARSFHHLFPVPVYEDRSVSHDGACFGCFRSLSNEMAHYTCPSCSKIFCIECDAFIHEKLHNCPGCELKANEG